MTAVRDQKTSTILERNTELTNFIREHGDKLGPLSNLSISSNQSQVQISSFSMDDCDERTAAALIAWFYLIDSQRFGAYEAKTWDDSICAHIDLYGSLLGQPVQIYATVHRDCSAYILNLDEVSVHSLRRIQIGDVPVIEAEAVPA